MDLGLWNEKKCPKEHGESQHLASVRHTLDTHTPGSWGAAHQAGPDLAASHAAFRGLESLCVGAALAKGKK